MSDTVTPDELEVMLKGRKPPRVIDVRRKADRENDPSMIPGAAWKDPEKVAEWAKELTGQTAVIYCARGGSVSKSTLEKLHGQNIDARYIEGGIEAWHGSGKSVTRKENT
jgi:rhodanese-related sulfurtransferase